MRAFISRKVGSDFPAVLQKKLNACSDQYPSVFGKKKKKTDLKKSFISKWIQTVDPAFTQQCFLFFHNLFIGNKSMCLKYKLRSVTYNCPHVDTGSYMQLSAPTF